MRQSLLFRACTNWRPLSQSSAEVPVTPGSNNPRFSSPSFRACANPRKNHIKPPERARSSGTCSSFGSSATWRGAWVRTPPDRGQWNCWGSVKSTGLPSWPLFWGTCHTATLSQPSLYLRPWLRDPCWSCQASHLELPPQCFTSFRSMAARRELTNMIFQGHRCWPHVVLFYTLLQDWISERIRAA